MLCIFIKSVQVSNTNACYLFTGNQKLNSELFNFFFLIVVLHLFRKHIARKITEFVS